MTKLSHSLARSAEQAEILRVSVRTVHRMVASGQLPGIRIGAQWRFNEGAVERWASEILEVDARTKTLRKRGAA